MALQLRMNICHALFISAAVSAAATEVNNPAPALGARLIPENRIVFDASSQSFVKVPGHLDAQKDSPAIVVLHPNSFREKYTIKVSKVNLFTAAPPAALSALLISSASSRSGATLPETVSRSATMLLPDQWKAFQKALDALKRTKYLSGEEILELIRRGRDNYEIREMLTQKIQETINDLDSQKKAVLALITAARADDASLDDDPIAFQASRDIQILAEAIDSPAGDLEKAMRAWNGAFATLPPPTDANKESYEKTRAANDEVSKAITAAKPQIAALRVMKHLYREVLLAPRVLPSRLVIPSDIAGADQVDVTVQVDQSPGSLVSIDPTDDKNPLNKIIPQDPTIVSRQYPTSIPVYWRFVRDFSAGLASTNLKQANFYIDKSVSPGVVRRGASDDKNIGAAVLAQGYLTTPYGVSVGPCIGVTVTDNARFLLGGSVVFSPGRRVRLSFSAGWAYGKVTVLNGDVENTPPNGSSVSTSSVYRQGTFNAATISITF